MRETYIYFLRPIGADGPVKIGCSQEPTARLVQMMTFGHSQLEIVATVPGGPDLELNLHECFLDTHSHREWFNASPRMTAMLTALQDGKPIHEAVDLSRRLGTFKRKGRGPAKTSDAWKERIAFNRRRRHGRREEDSQWPVDIDVLMTHAHRHTPFTDAQRARIEQVLADRSQLLTREQLADAYAQLRAPITMRKAA